MRRVLAGACIAACLVSAGCIRKPVRKPASAEKDRGASVVLPGRVRTTGPRIRWQQARPGGGLTRQIDVTAALGTVDPQNESGVMVKASGVLYVRNEPRARFEAPVVEAYRDRNTVIVPRGVHLASIAPPGIDVVADRLTWRADLGRITAEGNVRFVHRPPGAARDAAWGGPFSRVTLNTELERISIP